METKSRRRRGDDVDVPWRRSRGAAAATTWMFRGGGPARSERHVAAARNDDGSRDRPPRAPRGAAAGHAGVMVENVEKVLERGEKIELLVDKTDRLTQQAFKFESASRDLRSTMFWRKVKTYAMFIGLGGLVVFIVSSFVCGGVTYPRCRSSKS